MIEEAQKGFKYFTKSTVSIRNSSTYYLNMGTGECGKNKVVKHCLIVELLRPRSRPGHMDFPSSITRTHDREDTTYYFNHPIITRSSF